MNSVSLNKNMNTLKMESYYTNKMFKKIRSICVEVEPTEET